MSIVVTAESMDDVTFLKHMDYRHREELKDETPLASCRFISPVWVVLYRAYHHRLHKIHVYEHEHEADDE